MLFSELKQKSGMTLTQLSNYFGVPYRTIQNWAAGVSQCPDYLMKLFVYKMEQEGVLPADTPKLTSLVQTASRIKVKLDGDIQKYALSFLAIYNNVKSDADLLKVYNDYENSVYLVCVPEVEAEAVKFLSQFGEITRIDTIQVFTPVISNYDYPEGLDVEFLEYRE